MESLLTRKDVQARYGVHRTTVYRWERKEGLRFRRSRIKEGELAWWAELSDAAKRLGLRVAEVLNAPREDQERVLAAAHALRSEGS